MTIIISKVMRDSMQISDKTKAKLKAKPKNVVEPKYQRKTNTVIAHKTLHGVRK